VSVTLLLTIHKKSIGEEQGRRKQNFRDFALHSSSRIAWCTSQLGKTQTQVFGSRQGRDCREQQPFHPRGMHTSLWQGQSWRWQRVSQYTATPQRAQRRPLELPSEAPRTCPQRGLAQEGPSCNAAATRARSANSESSPAGADADAEAPSSCCRKSAVEASRRCGISCRPTRTSHCSADSHAAAPRAPMRRSKLRRCTMARAAGDTPGGWQRPSRSPTQAVHSSSTSVAAARA
jgi:hypothetical protein